MDRRSFVINCSLGFAALQMPLFQEYSQKDLIIGHGDFKYKVDAEWGKLNAVKYPVNDCHEMVIDKKGRIYLLTNHTKNNVLVYSQKGKLLDAWGTQYPGAHGLSIKDEGGEEFLYITDISRHAVFKTTLKGKEIMELPFPNCINYESVEQYLPTETCIDDEGNVYVSDGYGLQHILVYDSSNRLKGVFGGKGPFDRNLDNAHGICLDYRSAKQPSLLIADRMKNQLKRFSLSGRLLDVIFLPGAYICRPVIKGDQVYLATIWSGNGKAASGFISILDKNNQLISAPGGHEPVYKDGILNQMRQSVKVFSHPHDVCIDNDENIYVAQWNAGRSYPIKLVRV